jgi:hypothetical protein
MCACACVLTCLCMCVVAAFLTIARVCAGAGAYGRVHFRCASTRCLEKSFAKHWKIRFPSLVTVMRQRTLGGGLRKCRPHSRSNGACEHNSCLSSVTALVGLVTAMLGLATALVGFVKAVSLIATVLGNHVEASGQTCDSIFGQHGQHVLFFVVWGEIIHLGRG